MSSREEPSPEQRILDAAAQLLTSGGRDAVTARAVSAAARVQHPTIYRQFGDMQGLLEAVANRGFDTYNQIELRSVLTADPVEDLRVGWDLHVRFGLENPALYALMYGTHRPGRTPEAARTATARLRGYIHRIAEHGRLRMDVDEATQMIGAAGVGVVLALLGVPEGDRDLSLSARTREILIAGITTDQAGSAPSPAAHAIALRALLGRAHQDFTEAESALLLEWLTRIA